jgi:hypothetical protein
MDTKKNRKNLYETLKKNDYVTKLLPLLRSGWKLDEHDGRFVHVNSATGHSAPWVYVKNVEGLRCDILKGVFFDVLGHIPLQCRNCYKVVVRPRTVVELFDLYELQKIMEVPCMCGREMRPEVNGLWGGYFYCRGLEEGLQRKDEVRALIDKWISPEIPVFLKRYCTEYEINGPPSNETPHDITEEEQEMEDRVYFLFPSRTSYTNNPEWVYLKVMREWIEYAHAHGDNSYLELNGGESLVKQYVTYDREEGED